MTTGSFPWLDSATVLISSEVAANVPASVVGHHAVSVVDSRPQTWRRWAPPRHSYAVSFVVFGPEYGWPRARRRIVGFADVRSVHPVPRGMTVRPRDAAFMALRGHVSRALTRRADLLVVESPAMAAQVVARRIVPASRVAVVSNSFHGVFDRPQDWEPIGAIPAPAEPGFDLCYVSRAYPHKNHEFLALVAREARALGVRLRFVLTLDEGEWDRASDELRSCSVNLGPVSITQVPSVYQAVDGAVFPSLLEAFSATPLEAMRMDVPLFASDRDFVRSICADGATYFDPLDAPDAARSIVAVLTDPGRRESQVTRGRAVVAALPDAAARADATGSLIEAELDRAHQEVARAT
nr:glycosyltransferase [uncultured Nocardioides sp.]